MYFTSSIYSTNSLTQACFCRDTNITEKQWCRNVSAFLIVCQSDLLHRVESSVFDLELKWNLRPCIQPAQHCENFGNLCKVVNNWQLNCEIFFLLILRIHQGKCLLLSSDLSCVFFRINSNFINFFSSLFESVFKASKGNLFYSLLRFS